MAVATPVRNRYYERLRDFVEQTQDPSLPLSIPQCPNGCRDLHHRLGVERATGHVTEHFKCDICEDFFVRHSNRGETWITDKSRRVLRGFPNCYEHFIYTHRECGGDVTRRHTGVDGVSEVRGLSTTTNDDGTFTKNYRTFYDCKKCGASLEVKE